MAEDYYGAFAHENFQNSAYDEVGHLAEHFISRISTLIKPGMYEVDVAAPRALIVILTDILLKYGGGQYLPEAEVCRWESVMASAIMDEECWTCQPWTQEEKLDWLESCRSDFEKLREVCKEHWKHL